MNTKAEDIHLKIDLTLDEMFAGVKKNIKYQRNVTCTHCKHASKKCKVCKGHGLIQKEENVSIDIPAGVDVDMVLHKNNLGHHLAKNFWSFFQSKNQIAKAGDLHIDIGQIKHPLFQRDKDHLVYNYQISKSLIEESAQIIDITLLNGKTIQIEIPQHVTNRKILRLQGLGFNNITSGVNGDLLILLSVI